MGALKNNCLMKDENKGDSNLLEGFNGNTTLVLSNVFYNNKLVIPDFYLNLHAERKYQKQ